MNVQSTQNFNIGFGMKANEVPKVITAQLEAEMGAALKEGGYKIGFQTITGHNSRPGYVILILRDGKEIGPAIVQKTKRGKDELGTLTDMSARIRAKIASDSQARTFSASA